ncbi:hypothetical protein HYZ99_01985 [Candidatus Peregrinibacteria bacterium]|nr:hypothetical protein [Candidatus Peregrinibacteria bacterium]
MEQRTEQVADFDTQFSMLLETFHATKPPFNPKLTDGVLQLGKKVQAMNSAEFDRRLTGKGPALEILWRAIAQSSGAEGMGQRIREQEEALGKASVRNTSLFHANQKLLVENVRLGAGNLELETKNVELDSKMRSWRLAFAVLLAAVAGYRTYEHHLEEAKAPRKPPAIRVQGNERKPVTLHETPGVPSEDHSETPRSSKQSVSPLPDQSDPGLIIPSEDDVRHMEDQDRLERPWRYKK